MLPFWLSIGALSVVQGALVTLPAAPGGGRLTGRLTRLRRGGWAAILPLSVLAFVLIAREAERSSARGLTYLALIAVPPLAAVALGALSRGSRPWRALLVMPLFALAWADGGGLAGEAAALALSALSCVALGWLLAAITPARWLAAGIFAMALTDTALVISDLLQKPNSALNAAHPAAGLPRLQSAVFGSAVMGYGDLFVAAALGGLLAAQRVPQERAAVLTAALAVAFDLLFFALHELPATVPVAAALAVTLLSRRRSSAAHRGAGPARLAPSARARPAPRSPAR
jgi:hypothetical protein